MTEDPTVQFGAESVTQAAPPPLESTWGSFQLLTCVGTGGFGEVYRAWDPSLQREIALKLLLPGALDTEAEFQTTLREARALASVKHPNIVSIYGCDRHNGRVGFWTDFIHGKTLASLLVTQGPFGYHEAALIGLEVTRALSAVHRANLLHRDIKPENVMREEGGRILLMDFGLSALPQHTSQLAGTPNYMAPELFRRQPASVSSDIYAVGVLLYFLVTGQTPARLNGLTTAQAAEACNHRKPLIDLRSDLPEAFLRIVNRAIALNPDDRFRSAGEMAEALATSLGASNAAEPATPDAALAPPATSNRKQKKEKREERNPWVRLAIAAIVLFFVFGDRIPIIRSLFDHSPKSSSTSDKPEAPERPETREADEKPDTSDLYEQAQSLLLKSYKESNLTAAIDKFNQIPSSDPSYPLAQAGLGSAHFIQYRNSQDPKLLDLAVAETNDAIKLNPDAAPPYVTLARIAAVQGHNAVAMQMAEKAMSLDHSNADAYRAEADVLDAEGRHDEAIAAMQKAADLAPDDWRFPMNLGVFDLAGGKLQQAAEEFRRSAELAQDNGLAYYNLGIVELRLNQLDRAQDDLDRALKLDPHAGTYEAISWLDIQKGDYNAAVAASERAKNMDPTNYVSWHSLADAYRMIPADHDHAQDAYRKAIHYAEETHQKEPKNAELLASLAIYYARIGDSAHATTMIRQAVLLSPDDPRVDYLAGQAAEIVGDRDQAISLIAKCIGVGYSLAEINRNPDLASLRADPRFQQRLHEAAPAKS
jgi:serine/threonine protein kinase/Tfp pilus assembly protein PilF